MTSAAPHTAPIAPAQSCSPETPCAHCGLPVGRRPVGTDPAFCCSGCALVYETLRQTGLGDTFYRIRDRDPDARTERPPARGTDELTLSELDAEPFLEQHTRLRTDGLRETDLYLDGVHCAACVWLVERLPFEIEGVAEARLDLPRARLTLAWASERVALSDVARWLGRVGYAAQPRRRNAEPGVAERRLLRKAGVCWALAGNVMLLAFAFYAGLDARTDPGLTTAARWLSLGLALPAVLYGGSEFFRRAWISIRTALRARDARLLHMDTPIALGIAIGFGYSARATMSGVGEVWFDSITVLIAALLTARWLQLRSRRFAGEATDRLLALIPAMVRRIRPDGSVAIVPSDEVRPGDLVDVPAGEVIPVDGRVTAGTSSVDNAVLTGESRPVRVEPDAEVSAGATNLSAALQIRVAASGTESRIGRLLAWVRDGATRRAPVVLLADRLTGVFVLAVLTLAAATAAVWLAHDPASTVSNVVALLVVTCPCALGMATPLALAVATGRAARRGIFIKTDEALQLLSEVDAVVLDKTGTLTEGRLALLETAGDPGAAELGAVLETHGAHPIGEALTEALLDDPEQARSRAAEVRTETGRGLRGRVGGRRVQIGRPDWVARENTPLSPDLAAAQARWVANGLTPVAVAVDGRTEALLGLGDALRPEAADLVRRLNKAGKVVYLVSGDHEAVVRRVAAALGIASSHALGRIEPEAKQAFIEFLQAETGSRVAMVGDGVNDAAALRAADVGIAVHGGRTAALVAADAFLTRDGIGPLATLFEGAEGVMGVVRRNLAVSLFYNLLGAGAAMAGLVSPLVAAVAMPLSSLVVVGSSLAQRSFSPKPAR